MPNPYDDLFGGEQRPAFGANLPPMPQQDEHLENQPEALDEVLSKNGQFLDKAAAFSTLLSRLRAIDHQVPNEWLTLFVKVGDDHDQGSLPAEKTYHEELSLKFRLIIKQMRELAALHLDATQRFNNDIDDSYFSVEKTDSAVKSDKEQAVDGILLQRKILSEAAEHLTILQNALEACERRMEKYVNIGGDNNISSSELSLLKTKREHLTSGLEHQFDYAFFDANLLDKLAISLGVYLKENTSQYLQKLGKALKS